MSELHLHIVSFDIPYPPNYGGVIDVFHKIRALHRSGVKIHLHCFQYNREPSPELENYCEEVHCYTRQTGWRSAISHIPYIIFSRRSEELLTNLCKDNYPILFEGLHTCYYLAHPALKDRFKIYRESNIEHRYYYHLSKAEKSIPKKIFFMVSGFKLRLFQQKLSHAGLILTVSKDDNEYLASKFRKVKVEYLPSFHPDDGVEIMTGNGNFILYHGNLSVPENSMAAEFLATRVFRGSSMNFVIAGMNPSERLKTVVSRFPNVRLVINPSPEEMTSLIQSAQINVMVTFQPTGLKLKLLNALFRGRFCLVNRNMIAGTELEPVCVIADKPEELFRKAEELMKLTFSEAMIVKRREVLMKHHSNAENCTNLMKLLNDR